MRRRDKIVSKYNFPSSLKIGSHFTIKIHRLRNNAYAKIAVNGSARFWTFLHFKNISDELKSLKFRLGGFLRTYCLKKRGARIFRVFFFRPNR